MIYKRPKKLPRPDLRGQETNAHNPRWGSGRLVTFPVSYRYNGGISIGDDWYPGFEVPEPLVPKGYELIGIGVGLQLNARPPYATRLLRKSDKQPDEGDSELGEGCSSLREMTTCGAVPACTSAPMKIAFTAAKDKPKKRWRRKKRHAAASLIDSILDGCAASEVIAAQEYWD